MTTRLRLPRRILAAGAALALASLIGGCGGGETDVATALAEGTQAQAEGRVADAEERFTEVVEADPGNRVAWFNLGVLRRATGDLTGAIDAFTEVVDADAEFALVRFQRAISYQAVGDLERAVADLRIVVEQDPTNTDARRQLGALLVATGRVIEGRPLLDETLPDGN